MPSRYNFRFTPPTSIHETDITRYTRSRQPYPSSTFYTDILKIREEAFLLKNISCLYIIAIGKAAPAMASAAREIFGDSLSSGIVVSKYAKEHNLGNLEFHIVGYPIPDNRRTVPPRRHPSKHVLHFSCLLDDLYANAPKLKDLHNKLLKLFVIEQESGAGILQLRLIALNLLLACYG
ncbi:MAG: DUF4147 domain-containing protein [Anaerolineae bacterium]|jgi:hypothetical protein|nr:DUF4147 domain-containing protein [Anaerolineae bacterium]MBT7189213.1 DUF4147 domain-containing protein [Anaerolineae bacterium]MBT7991122.1 DUF4147 domain-containing protein [Anaerolineae bacterium]